MGVSEVVFSIVHCGVYIPHRYLLCHVLVFWCVESGLMLGYLDDGVVTTWYVSMLVVIPLPALKMNAFLGGF